MKSNFRTAIIICVVSYGFAVQVTCQTQNAASSPDKQPAPRTASKAARAQTALVDFAALEAPGTDPIATTGDAATPVATTDAASPAPIPAASASSSASTPPATVAVPLKNDAVVKELLEMKKQFAQMEAEMKARIGKLESELDTNPETGDSVSAEKDAGALRSAETGDTSGALTYGQAAAAPGPAAAPAAPDIDAQVTTKGEPFPGDWTWLNSNGHATDSPMSTKYFTPEFRADANYTVDYNHPEDDSLGGSTETFRSDEWQLEQVSAGGDIRIQNVRGRILTMDGLFATTTVRNDASPNRGQWDLAAAYKYVSEAWGGYHFDVAHGLNVDAGIFVSYIGLFSYYNFDNWTYQPSYVSSNTPWFFNGVRIQWFPTDKLKIEPWIINGWQSYAKTNGHPGLGGQILWRPKEWVSMVFNNYGMGTDTLGVPGRSRIHTDDSLEVRYYNNPENLGLDKMAFSLTGDLGCEYGGGVSCHNDSNGHPKQMFAGWMLYDRMWFHKDLFGITLGGGKMDNPGRYLTLLPPINGATAVSGSPYFIASPGAPMKAWDSTVTLDWMPSQFVTFRFETGYRYSSVPYWTGRGGITPPGGNVAPIANNGVVGTGASYICTNGATSAVSDFTPSGNGFTTDNALGAVSASCNAQYSTSTSTWTSWQPDLRKSQLVNTISIMVKF